MNMRSFPEQLEQILTHSVREASSLEHALQLEGQALSARDLDTLNLAIAEKQRQVERLEQLTREQGALLKREGYENNAQGMACCLRDWDTERILSPVWDRLVDIIARCRQLNLTNGGVVETKRRHVEQALHILRGEDARTELYGPRGRTTSSGANSRTITKA
ncbi:flagella synthesis protein FlgN [Ectothiorhodospira lacustris]|uniref:flagella synthesis protein FlgN n=1 Tax=Ectothiorhodospira lacustris TaxID=2899127 RepID=UPI001EE89734|nr:flagellar protein FlgN [Ectothiorhodospira lacustris]MCG5501215.1 flagellar protein FlgN [Ectothiorhodospira lacustris]MCG5511025.1 flagellar protein FlgN [Ectothiorhodospira lacustris]MCG5522755.1 flagellar protein FlgN [Ectothiorhodospira lacustris]